MAVNVLLEDTKGSSVASRRPVVSERWAGSALCVFDVLLLTAAGLGVLALRAPELSWIVIVVIGIGLTVFPAFKAAMGLYPGHGLSRSQRLRQVLLASGGAVLVNAALALALAEVEGLPRGVRTTIWPLVLTCAALVTIGDTLGRRILIRLNRWCQPVFIFGGGEAASEIVRQLALYPHLGFRAICIIDDVSIYIPDEQQGVPVARFKELAEHASLLAIATTALLVESSVDRSFVLRVHTQGLFQRILLVSHLHDLMSLKSKVRWVGGVLAIELGPERPTRWLRVIKRTFDVCVSACTLILLSPVLAFIALLVKTDSPGPVLFAQPRWAGGEQPFRMFKFRTMFVDGERRLRQHFLTNPRDEREYLRHRKLSNDPRVTRAGRFLRAASLDELPQLINVLRGEMSIIGPRPYTIDELSKLGPAAEILGLVKPGITGFWQVSGRNRRTFRERIEMDCSYVRNFSIMLDIWIIYRTVISILMRDGK